MVDIDFDNKWVKILFWIIVVVVFFYLYLIVEPRHNACWEDKRRECHLDKFKIDPLPDDTNADLLRRFEGYTRLDEEKVFWRRSLLNAIIGSIILLVLYKRKFDIPIKSFIIAVMILFIAFYFHNSYYTMHFDLRSNIFAQSTVNELRYRLKLAERPTAIDFNHIK